MDKNKKWIRTTVKLTFKERQGLWERVSRKITKLYKDLSSKLTDLAVTLVNL